MSTEIQVRRRRRRARVLVARAAAFAAEFEQGWLEAIARDDAYGALIQMPAEAFERFVAGAPLLSALRDLSPLELGPPGDPNGCRARRLRRSFGPHGAFREALPRVCRAAVAQAAANVHPTVWHELHRARALEEEGRFVARRLHRWVDALQAAGIVSFTPADVGLTDALLRPSAREGRGR